MQVQLREAKREDIPQMLSLYNEFTKEFVGSAHRNTGDFRRMLRKKDNVTWATFDEKNHMIGYAHARLEKRLNRGEFAEIVVSPKHDIERITHLLADKIQNHFVEKKVTSITAGSLRNPVYEKIFPNLGFFESESMGVFMYAILDPQKFLNEITPVFASRLKEIQEQNALIQIDCEGHSIFLRKKDSNVEPVVWTNQAPNLKIVLPRAALAKLVFGITEPVELAKTDEIKVESSLVEERTSQLLRTLFPKKGFLIMDYW